MTKLNASRRECGPSERPEEKACAVKGPFGLDDDYEGKRDELNNSFLEWEKNC